MKACRRVLFPYMAPVDKYIEMINLCLKLQIKERFGGKPYIFQQDSAPRRIARKVQNWTSKNYLKLLSWPANSPDMNHIGSLCDILKNEIHEASIINKFLLTECLIHVWRYSEKTKIRCRSLISGMHERVAAIKQAKRAQTKYQIFCFFHFYEHLFTSRLCKCQLKKR